MPSAHFLPGTHLKCPQAGHGSLQFLVASHEIGMGPLSESTLTVGTSFAGVGFGTETATCCRTYAFVAQPQRRTRTRAIDFIILLLTQKQKLRPLNRPARPCKANGPRTEL